MSHELEEQEAIGRRIKRRRLALGMPQADLGAAIGKTQGWVSKVEVGRIELDRTGLINAIASALSCHPNDLIGRPYTGTVEENQWQTSASSILRELRRYDLTPVFDGTPRPSAELWQETVLLYRLRDAAANTAIIRSLPDLFREARTLAEVSVGREREEAFAVYAVLCKFAHTAAHALGHAELIAMSCERAVWSAQLSGDPLMPSVANWMRVWDMWATADWEDAVTLSDRALEMVQDAYDRGDPLALRVWGSGQLRAAVSAARAGRREETEDRIRHAREAGKRLDAYAGPQPFDRYSLNFSSGNVQIHAISVALEMHDQTTAIDLERRSKPGQIDSMPNSRRGHHHMDMARAWMWDGNREKALAQLRKAEGLAPQLIRNHPIARSTLRQIVYAERESTREQLRGMSNRFHLDDQELFR
ncbi:helix-turn-helix domain-containing protein [Streptomyces violascens]|uniref:helix-turn-helix domain-containing protein n=1 Tax=Streptomyces violascens TaxID=67381 RepID=UPI003660D3CE